MCMVDICFHNVVLKLTWLRNCSKMALTPIAPMTKPTEQKTCERKKDASRNSEFPECSCFLRPVRLERNGYRLSGV